MIHGDAGMCAKFLRAHAKYLNTSKVEWPYVNSADAISSINNAAADIIEGKDDIKRDARIVELEQHLGALIVRWRDHGGKDLDEFVNRASDVLYHSKNRHIRPWERTGG